MISIERSSIDMVYYLFCFNNDKGIMNPIGNSAYVMEKYLRSQKIIFKRNKNWWAKDLPDYKNRFNIDEIILDIIPDPNLAYEKFLKGDIDQISFNAEQWNNKVTGMDKEKFGTSPQQKKVWSFKEKNKFPKPYTFIAWNLKNPLFQNVKTRTALSYLVDYKKINDTVYYNLYTQSTSPFGSFTDNSDPELRKKMRGDYANDTAQLIASANVVAIEFQTIAQANNYWKK